MKYVLTFFLVVCMMWSMVSCRDSLVYMDDSADVHEERTSDLSWMPLSAYSSSAFYMQKVYEYGSKFVETEHAIVFVDTRDAVHLCYINKKSGDVRILCGDPLCRHTESEMCSAVCDVSTASSLTYSPDNGRLYFVRRNDIMASPQERCSTIVSVGIDHMDFTVKQHYALTPGNEITSMKYSGGKLYFSYIVTEDDTEKLMLSSLSVSDNTIENVCHFDYINTRYAVQDDVIYYYNTGDNILYSYDTASDTRTTLVNTKSVNKYFVSEEYLYCQTPDSITRIRLSDQQNTTIFKSKEISSDFDCTADSAGNIYFYGYTPEIVETSRGQMTNDSGGKIFRLSDSSEEVFADLGSSTFIKSVCAVQNVIFIETYTYNANKNTEYMYYYIYDHTLCQLPGTEISGNAGITAPDNEAEGDLGIRYEYSEKEDGYIITQFITADSDVIVPEAYNHKRVYAIAPNVFDNNSEIQHVTIPASIKEIGEKCFYHCINLKSVVIESQDTISIGQSCFMECTNLTSAEIHGKLLCLPDRIFAACTSLEAVTLPDTLIKIDEGAFVGCASLRSLDIPDSVSSIGEAAFMGCSGLQSVILPDHLESISKRTFSRCTSLSEVYVPAAVITIDSSAFSSTPALGKIEVDTENPVYQSVDGMLTAKESAELLLYPSGKRDETLTIPPSITLIGERAFSGENRLRELILHDGMTEIKNKGGHGCTQLERLVILAPDMMIHPDAFYRGEITYMNGMETDRTPYTYPFIVYCLPGSTAIPYAEDHTIPFVLMEQEDTKG